MARDTKLVEPEIVRRAIGDSFASSPALMRNPVMFVVGGPVLTTACSSRPELVHHERERVTGLVALFLWFTVLFANSPKRSPRARKAQAETLRSVLARDRRPPPRPDGTTEECASTALDLDDEVGSRASDPE
jgi:high-affinity K+ transport system ATPase subunit B